MSWSAGNSSGCLQLSQDEVPPTIEIDRSPTAEEEAESFSSSEARARRKHELDITGQHLGMIGKFTGSTNPSLNIATVIAAGFFIVLLIVVVASFGFAESRYSGLIEKLIAALLSVASFIFGVRQGDKKD